MTASTNTDDGHDHIAAEVSRIFQAARDRYAHQKLEPGPSSELFSDWLTLAREVGIDRFAAAVARARLASDFIPGTVAIRECVVDTRELGRRGSHCDCINCDGTGWVRVGETRPGKLPQFSRCRELRTKEAV